MYDLELWEGKFNWKFLGREASSQVVELGTTIEK
jgi:hypothetical protein